MDLIAAWVGGPALLAALASGVGLGIRAALDRSLPGALVPALGMAGLIVIGGTLGLDESTSGAIVGVSIVAATGGLILAVRTGGIGRPDGAALVAGLAVFAVFAAPIVFSGEATFAGYIKLDDTATWLALTDNLIGHGASVAGLAHSSYEQTLSVNLHNGYPLGGFAPLAIAANLTSIDPAWLFQPFLALLAALLAVSLYSLTEPLVGSRRLRVVIAVLAAQPALLTGYYLWGGIKELLAAWLAASAAGLAAHLSFRPRSWRAVLPLALVVAALAASVSPAGIVWAAPALALAAISAWRRSPPRRRRALVIGAALLTAGAAAVALFGPFLKPTRGSLTNAGDLGNLGSPLDPLEIVGVWPASDFRLDLPDPWLSGALLGAVVVAALAGIMRAWRSRAGGALALFGGLLVSLAVAIPASPWIAAKAMAIAAPAIPFAAGVGAASLFAAGRRTLAGIALAALVAGIAASTLAQYGGASLAPRDQLSELERAGEMLAGRGPVLMTEYQPYGVRHFLRDADPEGASELRYHRVSLAGGGVVEKGHWADTDEFDPRVLGEYRALVLRRTPEQSRPPGNFRLAWRGEYYEVWRAGHGGAPVDHLALGHGRLPDGVPSCAQVLALAGRAGSGGRLAAARPSEPALIRNSAIELSPGWTRSAGKPVPSGAGTLRAALRLELPGRYDVWLRGSVRPRADLEIDGRPSGSVRHQLQNGGLYTRLGSASLAPGRHDVQIAFSGADLAPGSAGSGGDVGPIALTRRGAGGSIRRVAPAAARSLCGKRWDWIEALPARSSSALGGAPDPDADQPLDRQPQPEQ